MLLKQTLKLYNNSRMANAQVTIRFIESGGPTHVCFGWCYDYFTHYT